MAGSKVTILLALAIAVASVIGIAPRDARAQICKKVDERKGCVISSDVQNDSLELRNLKNEAGVAGTDPFRKPVGLGEKNRVIADTRIKTSRDGKNRGYAVVTASVAISPLALGTKGASVRCEIQVSAPHQKKVPRKKKVFARKPFYDSISSENDLSISTVNVTMGVQIRAPAARATLLCRVAEGGGVQVSDASLVVQFYPTLY